MVAYKTIQVTPKEYELLMEARRRLMVKGIPRELMMRKSIDDVLQDLRRSTFARGAIVGLGLAALLYLLTKKSDEGGD